MTIGTSQAVGHRSAIDLLKLPPHERDAILRAAAEQAEKEYCEDAGLTDFEAFGAGDLYGESASTETRQNLAD